jgi:alcohol dehydrogenase class IV
MAKQFGIGRCLVVTGGSPDRVSSVVRSLRENDVSVSPYSFKGEPTVDVVREAVGEGRAQRCDGIVAIGGGSPLEW